MKTQEILSQLSGVRKQSKGFLALCPAHDDHEASLSLKEGDKGVVLHCFTGCSVKAICEAIGIKERDLFFEPLPKKNGWDLYPIKDTSGRLVAVRKRKGSGDSKKMAWEQPNGKSGLKGVKIIHLPLFGSEQIQHFDPSRWVELSEGEAKTYELQVLGAQALGTCTGASTLPSKEVLSCLRGFKVRLWPDNDDPGRLHMKRIAQILRELGCEVVILNTRGLPQKGDAVQWLFAQRQSGATTPQLKEMLFGKELPGLPIETQWVPTAQPTAPLQGPNSSPTGTLHLPNGDPTAPLQGPYTSPTLNKHLPNAEQTPPNGDPTAPLQGPYTSPTGTQQLPYRDPTPPQQGLNAPFGDIPVFTLSQLLALDIPDRVELCGPFVENSIGMVFAPPGIGKSWFAEGLALAVATGTPFLKWKTPRPRKVLLVDGELNAKDFQVRFQKMTKAIGATSDENLRVILANLCPTGTLPDLRTEEGQSFIESQLEGVDFLILDSRSTLLRYQDENESSAWQEAQDWFQKIRQRCAILLVHHANKAGNQRGSSALEVLPELILKLDRPADYHPSEGARFVVSYPKARNLTGEQTVNFECRLEADERGEGVWWTWCAASGGKKTAIVEKLKENPELGVRALARAVGADPGYVSQVKKQYQASLGVGRGGVVVGSLENRTQQHPPSPSPQSEATPQQIPNTEPTLNRKKSLFAGVLEESSATGTQQGPNTDPTSKNGEAQRVPNTSPTVTQHPLPTAKDGEATGTQHLMVVQRSRNE